VSGLVCCVAVLQGSFALLLLGTFGCGFYAAGHMSYRFASTDTATDAYKPIAISYVLAGGVLAGVIGASVVIFTKDLWPPYLFAATFIAQAGLALLAGLALSKLKLRRRCPERRSIEAARWAKSCAVRNSSWPCSSACRATR
jgi:hypothetical protein